VRALLSALATVAFAMFVTPADAAHWAVDHAKSSLGFTVNWSGEPFSATFRNWNADIALDPADLSHARIVASIDLASEASDTPDNDAGLKGPEGFWVERFRIARFESNAISSGGGNKFLARGTLSLHGLTREIALPFTLDIQGDSAHASGRVRVLRTDFALGTGEWAAPTPIAHEVDIRLDIAAKKLP
jgi:polyisoprenoid-binding protein YceI